MKKWLVLAIAIILCFGLLALRSSGSKRRFVDRGIGYIVWTKNAESLFYTKNGNQLHRFDVETGNRQVYKIPELLDVFDVSPDGGSIALIHRSKPGLYTLALSNRRLVKVCYVRNDREVTSLSWCRPNLVLLSQDAEKGLEDIFLVDVRHNTKKLLIADVAALIGSTADGTGLLYDDGRSLHYYSVDQETDRVLNLGRIAAEMDDISFLFLSAHQAIVTPGPRQIDLKTMKTKQLALPDDGEVAMISPDLAKCLSGESAHPSAIFGWRSNSVYVAPLPQATTAAMRRMEQGHIGTVR